MTPLPSAERHGRRLPPGQHEVDGFPRFGANLSRPAPAVPADPVIKVRGAVTDDFELPVSTVAGLARCELDADFHCVAGWSATGLHWEGVAFETAYRTLIEPALRPGAIITHVEFRGLDGWQSIVTIEDALTGDVLLADRLDGRPLDGDHGAPLRVVSPDQYGYMSTKHLCRIAVHTSEPKARYGSLKDRASMWLIKGHPRARVWEEERHRYLPSWSVRRAYRLLADRIAPLTWKRKP